MIRILNIRSLISLALLWLATSALVSSLNTSIVGLGDAAFLPVAIIALMMAFMLGFGNWPAYRAWALIIFVAPPLIVLQVTHTAYEVGQMLIHLPSLLINRMLESGSGQPVDDPFFQAQLDAFFDHIGIFLTGLTTDSHGPGPSLLELLWAIPLFLACAWAGWWTSRRGSILTALIPSLGLHAFILNYAHKLQGPSLQIGAFTLIVLMGLHQKWNLLKSESKTQSKVHVETYARVFILSCVLALAAGLIPIIPAPEKITKPPEQEEVKELIEREGIQSNTNQPPDLPQEHLINTPPQDLMRVVFLANVVAEPFLGQAETGLEPVAPGYHWRWLTYDNYDGNSWSSSPGKSATYSADEALFEFSGEAYRAIHQTIIKATTQDKHLYWSGSLMRADQPIEVTWRTRPSGENPLLSMDMLGALTQAQQFSADSLLPRFTEIQMQAASQEYPTEILQKYLPLPSPVSQRVRDLAATLTSEAQNPYDKAEAIEAYLRTYPYTLDVPDLPANREIADYFLFELKTGFCDYYATSMVVLARAAGLPARLVIGYASAEYDPATAQYIVREANAHSWVEIYFPEIGWVEFEPTANQPLIERQPPLPTAEPTPTPEPTPEPPPLKNRDEITYQKNGRFPEQSLLFNILLSILTIVVICWWYLRVQGIKFSYKTIGSMYKYIYRHGKKIAPDSPTNATPSLFAEKLKSKLRVDHRFLLPAADELDELTALYLQETYSPHPVTKDEQDQAVKIWYRLVWRLLYIRMILRFRPGTRPS